MTNSWKLALRSFSVACAVFLWGCTERSNPGGADRDESGEEAALCSIEEAINYSEHIAKVLNQNCASCHSSSRAGVDRNSAPDGVNFDSPEGALQSAEVANRRIQADEMPPSAPLNACEKGAFSDWVESGAPK